MKCKPCLQIAILATVVTLLGCIPSLHPIYTDADLIYDPALVGEWVGDEINVKWTVLRNGEKQYRLISVDEAGKEGRFDLYLAKVGEQKFIDLYPIESESKQNEFYTAHMVPVHTFMKVKQIEPTLQLAIINTEWLDGFLKQDPAALKHEIVQDTVVLTAGTKDLQAFVTKHAATPSAWSDCSPFKRKPEPTQKQP